jgi:hypothetical protein
VIAPDAYGFVTGDIGIPSSFEAGLARCVVLKRLALFTKPRVDGNRWARVTVNRLAVTVFVAEGPNRVLARARG